MYKITYVQELRERLRATNQVEKENIKQLAKIQVKKQYDKTSREKTFQVGDMVLLYDETIRRSRSKKLESKWIGPYTVIEKHNDVNHNKTGTKTNTRTREPNETIYWALADS